LLDAEAEAPRLDEELRAERGAAGMDRDTLPHAPAEQLEGAVDVAGRIAEQRVHQELPAPGVEQANRRVSPAAAPADHEVGLVVHGGGGAPPPRDAAPPLCGARARQG